MKKDHLKDVVTAREILRFESEEIQIQSRLKRERLFLYRKN